MIFQSAQLLSQPDSLFGGKDVWKYLLRSLTSYSSSREWASYLTEHEHGRQLAQLQPQLLFKLQRPYLRKQVSTAQKLTWLRQHYGWMLSQWSWPFVHRLFKQGGIALAAIPGDDGNDYALWLRPTARCDKEGDLMLTLEQGDEPLAFISFTLHRINHEWVANIGCLQGPRPEVGRDAVKLATQAMHGLRPKQAVLTALYGLTAGYGIDRILAVSNESHVYQARSRRKARISADYDSFWQEMGGERVGDSFALLPRMPRKALEAIPSRKRAQYRRRHELENTMIDALRAALPNSLRDAHAFGPAVESPTGGTREPNLDTVQLDLVAT